MAVTTLTAETRPWPDVLAEETDQPYFQEILQFVEDQRRESGDRVFPSDGEVFAAFHLTPFAKVRVVIVGQDPYPTEGHAHGLSFSVPAGAPTPSSLRNIKAALCSEEIDPPEHGDLTGWATQGVLLLNTTLTVPEGEAGSSIHAKRWRPFTDAVMQRLSDREQPIVFVLWGRKAQRYAGLIDTTRHEIVAAPHPASRGRHQAEFRASKTFSRVDEQLKRFGGDRIDWSLS